MSTWTNPLGSSSALDESTDKSRPRHSLPSYPSSRHQLSQHLDQSLPLLHPLPPSHSPIKKRSIPTSLRSVSGQTGFPSVTDSYRPTSSTPSISPEKRLEALPPKPVVREGGVAPVRDWRTEHGLANESERWDHDDRERRRATSLGNNDRHAGYSRDRSPEGLNHRGSSSKRRDEARYAEEGTSKGRDERVEGRGNERNHDDASRGDKKRRRDEEDYRDTGNYRRTEERSGGRDPFNYASRDDGNDHVGDRSGRYHASRADHYAPSSQQYSHRVPHEDRKRQNEGTRDRVVRPPERSQTTRFHEPGDEEDHRRRRDGGRWSDRYDEGRGYGGGAGQRYREDDGRRTAIAKDGRDREDRGRMDDLSHARDQARGHGDRVEPHKPSHRVGTSKDDVGRHDESDRGTENGGKSYPDDTKRHNGDRNRSHENNVNDSSQKLKERVRRDSWKPHGESSTKHTRSPSRHHKRQISSESREEGELDETDPVIENHPFQPSSPSESPPKSSPEKPARSSYKPIIIKNRPTKVQNPYRGGTSPEPPRAVPSIISPPSPIPPPPIDNPPPPPLDDAPPPPSDMPPSPMEPPPPLPDVSPPAAPSAPTTDHLNPITPHQPTPPEISISALSQTSTVDNVEPPPILKNRQLEMTKSNARLELPPPPSAPNPNLLNPPTRPTTPIKVDRTPSRPDAPRKFVRPTMDEEMKRYRKSFKGCSTMDAYETGVKLGEGTFGVVTKGTEIATKREVALKKLIMHNQRDGVSLTTKREIQILKALSHENVVPLLDMIVHSENGKSGSRTDRNEIFMVFPFMDHDLCGLLSNQDFKTSISLNKFFMKQLLEGMAYIHSKGCVHRDIKTANILVDRKGGIMIADFGLARCWKGGQKMPNHSADELTNMVVTRWYRAPELFLGETRYGPAIDIWSIGCVMGELYKRSPILPGATDAGQLEMIVERCGPLNDETMPGWRLLPGVPNQEGRNWDNIRREKAIPAWAKTFGMDFSSADIMSLMFTLDPNDRPTAKELLNHGWFWVTPLPSTRETTNITVSCSHEMNTRQDDEWNGPSSPTSADFKPQALPPMRPKGAIGRPLPGLHNQYQPNRPPFGNPVNVRPGQNNMNRLNHNQPHPNLQGLPHSNLQAQNGMNQQMGNQSVNMGPVPPRPYGNQPPYNNNSNYPINHRQPNTNGYNHNQQPNTNFNAQPPMQPSYPPPNPYAIPPNQNRSHVPPAPFILAGRPGPVQGHQQRFPNNPHVPPPMGITLAGPTRSRTMPMSNGYGNGDGMKRSAPRDAPTGPSLGRGGQAKRSRSDLEEGEEPELDYGP